LSLCLFVFFLGKLMIDLAPNHKLGLSVKNPVLLAGGTIGYGEAIHSGLDLKPLGGVVVGPLLRHSAAGPAPPRLAEVPGGFVMAAGTQNRGIQDVIKRFARLWARLGTPVIVQVAEQRPDALAFLLEQLVTIEAVVALELLIGQGADAESVKRMVQTTAQISDLPIWVKTPLAETVRLAPIAVDAGAVGVVVGQPPLAAAQRPALDGVTPTLVYGSLHGPATYPLMLATLLAVSRLALPAALIACGGIHTPEQAQTVLRIPSVCALQVDSALWVEPGLPAQLAMTFQGVEVGQWTVVSDRKILDSQGPPA
jgi:dihydroorotate dehydrogenase (NAD+) catalytic subunit